MPGGILDTPTARKDIGGRYPGEWHRRVARDGGAPASARRVDRAAGSAQAVSATARSPSTSLSLERARRRAGRAHRPVRLRQVDRAADDQPADRAVQGPDPASTARTSPAPTRCELRRRIGYVIQNVGLFPHQTIRTNVGTVPRLLGWPQGADRGPAPTSCSTWSASTRRRYGKRYPHELSGGQRQRVGVARALAADPVVLLMDEPFSAVDPIVRGRLQEEFLRLQAEVRKTIVLVTHDLDEAVRLGDRIAVLSEGGRLEQFATPAELLGEPASPFVREFVGADRGIRRLAVTPIAEDDAGPLGQVEDDGRLPTVELRHVALRRARRDAGRRTPTTCASCVEDGEPAAACSAVTAC